MLAEEMNRWKIQGMTTNTALGILEDLGTVNNVQWNNIHRLHCKMFAAGLMAAVVAEAVTAKQTRMKKAIRGDAYTAYWLQ